MTFASLFQDLILLFTFLLAGFVIREFVKPLQTVVRIKYRLHRQRQQSLPCLGKHHLMTVTVEQRLSQFVLQLQNLMRQCALCDEQFLCRCGEIQCL